ncbi:MAG: 4-alpha-glucanotransferase [Oscillospiraceae bacterium]|nr:4-alpha-glucanotransferase [Oscillospiraceae bacterium]
MERGAVLRSSGILMHLSSLPSPGGIGTMGREARAFVDFLVRAGQSCWQILPVCPTSFGDSPYQSFSTFAGNPYFIDLETLETRGLLKGEEYRDIDWESAPDDINYGIMYEKRYPVLRRAAERFLASPPEDFGDFCRENAFWLEDYALFMALKDRNGGAAWLDWPEPERNRDPETLAALRREHAGDLDFWRAVQYLFFAQWRELRAYANGRGIEFIGDLPIYVSLDSVDVWAHPELFQLDENHVPREVAGCPPDGFSETGQLWGNPLFDWDRMAEDDYAWWTRRIGFLCGVYNRLRIDHFRGFDAYYAIPYGDPDARRGVWKEGPGMKLFRAVERSIGPQPIIAEDLGFLTDSVRQLLKDSGFPGMKVLEFAFDSRDPNGSDYLPHCYPTHCVAYTGTHDNDTLVGWLNSADPADVAYARAYLRLTGEEDHWGMMQALWATTADLTVVQAQDILGLGSEARMNIPSTVGTNWRWRALPGSFTPELADRLRENMQLYRRLPE